MVTVETFYTITINKKELEIIEAALGYHSASADIKEASDLLYKIDANLA